jgi:hypothetical protein
MGMEYAIDLVIYGDRESNKGIHVAANRHVQPLCIHRDLLNAEYKLEVDWYDDMLLLSSLEANE